MRLEVHRGVGDVDRRVVDADLARRRGVGLEDDVPARGGSGEGIGVVEEEVRAAAVRDAVGDAVDAVVVLQLQAVEDVRVVRDEGRVDRRDEAGRDEALRRVTRGRHAVVAAALHELHHVRRVGAVLGLDLAAGLRLERRDPVVVGVVVAALRIAGPDDEVDLALARAERRLGRVRCGASLACRQDDDHAGDDRQ